MLEQEVFAALASLVSYYCSLAQKAIAARERRRSLQEVDNDFLQALAQEVSAALLVSLLVTSPRYFRKSLASPWSHSLLLLASASARSQCCFLTQSVTATR